MISSKFLKSSVIYSFVGALPLLSGFVLLFFYTGGILSTKTYGYLTLHLTFTLLFQSFITFCLESYIGPIYFEYKKNYNQLKIKIASINYYSLAFALFVILIISIIGPFTFKYSFDNVEALQFFPFVFSSLITAFFNSYFKIYSNYLIFSQQQKTFLIANLINFFSTILFSLIGLYWFKDSVAGPLFGRFISGLIIFTLAFYYMQTNFGYLKDPSFFKSIKLFCIPLIIYSILNWIYNYADRIFIEKLLNTDLVGLFDFGIKCTLGIEIIFTGMNNSIYPKLYEIMNSDYDSLKIKEHVNKYASGYLIVVIISIAVTLFFIPFVITFLIKNIYYHKAMAFIALLCIAQLFKVLYYIYLAPLFFYKKTDLIAKSFIYITITQLLITIILVKYLGFNGILLAFVLSKPFQILFVYFESNKYYDLKINYVKQIFLPVFLVTIVLALQILIQNNQTYWYNPFIALIILVITLIFYRKEIRPLYSYFFKIELKNV